MARRGCALAVMVVTIAIACNQSAHESETRGRVLLIGLDGATLRVVEPLMREGRLPNLARIAADGVHGPLQSFLPLHSPRIWNTIATGKVPEKHGILSFAWHRDDGSTALYLSSDRKTHALWNIASDAGVSTSVVNWWTTFPPEQIDGVMVTDHLVAEEVASLRSLFRSSDEALELPTVYPSSWQDRALDLARDESVLVETPNPLAALDPYPRWSGDGRLIERVRADTGVMRIALAIEEERKPTLMMVFLSGIDKISHELWGALEPTELYPEDLRPTTAEQVAGTDALNGYYVFTDQLVGLLLARYGPDDLVLVVSDHGFEAAQKTVELGTKRVALTGGHDSEAASRGILFARGPGVRRGAKVDGTTVNDVTPTILTWLRLPVASDMDGHPAAFLDREPLAPIPTYDTKPVDRVGTPSRGAEREVIENLRALGYIE